MKPNPESPEPKGTKLSQPTESIAAPQEAEPLSQGALPPEFGGRKGPEATRFGDWELNGKCVDF